ncbi:MAG: hypothetical protein ACKO1K_08205 [Burkholderiales bacterium]
MSSRTFGKSTSNYPFRQADLPGQQNWTLPTYGAKSKLIKASLADTLPKHVAETGSFITPSTRPWRTRKSYTIAGDGHNLGRPKSLDASVIVAQ